MVTLPAPGGAAAAGGQTARGGGEMGGVRPGRHDRRISQVWMLERNDFFFFERVERNEREGEECVGLIANWAHQRHQEAFFFLRAPRRPSETAESIPRASDFFGFFYPYHYNFLSSEICHYNSPILKPAITIFRFFESCHFIRL